jgi:hypothetical protein
MLDRHRSAVGQWDWPQHSVSEIAELAAISYPAGLEWIAALRPIDGPELRRMKRLPALEVYHVDLGGFRSAPEPFQGTQTLCYGKFSKCLDDCNGSTTCQEVNVAKRLTAAGWEAGWWNTYSATAPANWRIWEIDKGGFRKILRDRLSDVAPVFNWSGGVPDVIAWRIDGADFRMVAVECKCISRPRDVVKLDQERWMAAAPKAGLPLSSLVIAEWRVDPTVNCE